MITGRGNLRQLWDDTDLQKKTLELLQQWGFKAVLMEENIGRLRIFLGPKDVRRLQQAGRIFAARPPAPEKAHILLWNKVKVNKLNKVLNSSCLALSKR